MNQSDYRMGWAPAMLCIEDEPKKPAKPAPWYGYRGRTNDEFEVGDHSVIHGYRYKGTYSDIREEDCVQGVRAERLAAKKTGKFVNISTPFDEYLNRCESRAAQQRTQDILLGETYFSWQRRREQQDAHNRYMAKLCDQLGMAPREYPNFTPELEKDLIVQRSDRANKTASGLQLMMQAGADRAKELRQLTQEKCDAAAAKLDLSMSTNWGIRYVIKDEDA